MLNFLQLALPTLEKTQLQGFHTVALYEINFINNFFNLIFVHFFFFDEITSKLVSVNGNAICKKKGSEIVF